MVFCFENPQQTISHSVGSMANLNECKIFRSIIIDQIFDSYLETTLKYFLLFFYRKIYSRNNIRCGREIANFYDIQFLPRFIVNLKKLRDHVSHRKLKTVQIVKINNFISSVSVFDLPDRWHKCMEKIWPKNVSLSRESPLVKAFVCYV